MWSRNPSVIIKPTKNVLNKADICHRHSLTFHWRFLGILLKNAGFSLGELPERMPGLRQIKEILESPRFFASQPEGRSAACRSVRKKNPWKMCEMRSADRYEEKGVKTEKLKRKRKRGTEIIKKWKRRNGEEVEGIFVEREEKRTWNSVKNRKSKWVGEGTVLKTVKRKGGGKWRSCKSIGGGRWSSGTNWQIPRRSWNTARTAISIDGHPDDKQKRRDAKRKDVTPMLWTIRMIDSRE